VPVKQVAAQENIAPNLIPMVDIMFLLLLFFMLGADMGQRELEEVKLPVAADVHEDKDDAPSKKAQPRVNVNVYHDNDKCVNYKQGEGICIEDAHWKIGIHGNSWDQNGNPIPNENVTGKSLHDFLSGEADLERTDPNNLSVSDRRVMIRADAASLYGFVQKVMNACAEVGIYKVEIGAAQKMIAEKVGE
jgi:biopolymer transport protein ExbD